MIIFLAKLWYILGFPHGSTGKESACSTGDVGSIPGLGRSQKGIPKGKDCPLQYSGLENYTDYIVHGVSKSWTGLRDFHFLLSILLEIFMETLDNLMVFEKKQLCLLLFIIIVKFSVVKSSWRLHDWYF